MEKAEDLPTKFCMMCLIRPEILLKFCDGARKSLGFAQNVASTSLKSNIIEEKDTRTPDQIAADAAEDALKEEQRKKEEIRRRMEKAKLSPSKLEFRIIYYVKKQINTKNRSDPIPVGSKFISVKSKDDNFYNVVVLDPHTNARTDKYYLININHLGKVGPSSLEVVGGI